MIDLGPADRLAAGAIGEPGARTFYIQVEAAGTTHWYLLEKQQLAVLAERSLELVRSLDSSRGRGPVPELDLDEPTEVAFRVGEIALAYAPGAEAVTIRLRSTDEDDDAVEFQADLDQIEAMALFAAEVVTAGRPLCPRCNLPLDPDGHVCPSSNGDLRTGRR